MDLEEPVLQSRHSRHSRRTTA